MKPMQQGTSVVAKRDFSFRVLGKGRSVAVLTGQRFWITNSTTDQTRTGFILVSREGKGVIGHGWAFTPSQFADAFDAP